jgi:hypothetical protein
VRFVDLLIFSAVANSAIDEYAPDSISFCQRKARAPMRRAGSAAPVGARARDWLAIVRN